jgi:thioredoxin 1
MRLLHFTADWCQPCKMMKPIIKEVLDETDGIEYTSIDIDEHPETASDYGVMSIPTFIILDDSDTVVATTTGAMTKQVFKQRLSI